MTLVVNDNIQSEKNTMYEIDFIILSHYVNVISVDLRAISLLIRYE